MAVMGELNIPYAIRALSDRNLNAVNFYDSIKRMGRVSPTFFACLFGNYLSDFLIKRHLKNSFLSCVTERITGTWLTAYELIVRCEKAAVFYQGHIPFAN